MAICFVSSWPKNANGRVAAAERSVPRAGGDECRRRLNSVRFRRSKSEQILVQFLLGYFVSCSVGISSREMDIGVMESFFALVQKNILHRKSWVTWGCVR